MIISALDDKFNDGILMLLRISFVFFSCFMLSGYTMATKNKVIYGYVEKVTLVDKNLILSAKLDTGAKTASLFATNISQMTINGVNYLNFTVPSKQGNISFVAEYLGKVKIKVRAGERNQLPLQAFKRPVVLMRLKMGNNERLIPVNLTDRKHFIYPLLLGRDAINAFDGIVDPGSAFNLKTR